MNSENDIPVDNMTVYQDEQIASMTVFCEENDEEGRIYTDFSIMQNDDFLIQPGDTNIETPVRQAYWGNHESKPNNQIEWEKSVDSICQSIEYTLHDYLPYIDLIASMGNDMGGDTRPRLHDGTSKKWILLDFSYMEKIE